MIYLFIYIYYQAAGSPTTKRNYNHNTSPTMLQLHQGLQRYIPAITMTTRLRTLCVAQKYKNIESMQHMQLNRFLHFFTV